MSCIETYGPQMLVYFDEFMGRDGDQATESEICSWTLFTISDDRDTKSSGHDN